jgi:hypothetical protein
MQGWNFLLMLDRIWVVVLFTGLNYVIRHLQKVAFTHWTPQCSQDDNHIIFGDEPLLSCSDPMI